MGWWPWKTKAKTEEAVFTEAAGASVSLDEPGFRRLTGDSNRNLDPLTHKRMQDLAVYLWKSNPLARRIIEQPIAYLLAGGVTVSSETEEVQTWLNDWWNDPINNLDIRLPEILRGLSLFGETCWLASVSDDGRVRLGYIDSGNIATLVMDPDNPAQPVGVVTTKDRKGRARRYRIIIGGDEDLLWTDRTREIRESFTDGEVFYFRVNGLVNTDRGHSDILAEMDWIDAYQNSLFGELERWEFLRAFVWDVNLRGSTPEQVASRAREISPPSPGSVRVHNDSEEWKAVTPSIGSGDAGELARLFRNHILGGSGLPEHWFGGGGDVNRSTGESMMEPTFKTFELRQEAVGFMLREMARHAVRQRASIARRSEADELAATVRVRWPEMTRRDSTAFSSSLQQVAGSAIAMVNNNLLSHQAALDLIAGAASQLGVKIDTARELEEAAARASRAAEDDSFPGFAPKKAASDGR